MKTLSIEERKNITPQKALDILLKGNERFVKQIYSSKNYLQVLSEFSNEQKPFAFVLSCIDSRAPVEIIFDQGIGDLLSARIAGNVINEDIIASAEFATQIIGVKLIMILGHTNCGAMSACLNHKKDGHLKYLVDKIESVYLKHSTEIDTHQNPADKLAEYNVKESAQILITKSPIIRHLLQEKQIQIATALYYLNSGKVQLISTITQPS